MGPGVTTPLGRPPIRLTPAQIRYVKRARAGRVPMARIAKTVGMCRCTLYVAMRRYEASRA
jgi:DNA-binding phage protein